MSIQPTNTAPIRWVWSPDMQTVVCGPLSDELHAKARGKLLLQNTPEFGAERLNEAELSDFIDFHVVGLVLSSSRPKYEAGAARWASRVAPMKAAA